MVAMDIATTGAAAPAPEPTDTSAAPAAAVDTPAKPLSKQERRQALIDRLRGKEPAAAKPAEPAVDEPASDDKDKDEPKEPKTDEPKDEPKPAAAKDDGSRDLELATAKRELKNARADLLEAKPLLEKAKRFEAELAKAKEDPNAALSALKTLFGRDFGELTQWFVENKENIKTQQRYAELPPDVREELELSRKEREAKAAADKEAADKAAYVEKHGKYSSKISEYLATHEDEFPLASAFGKAVADDVARWACEQKGPVDARARLQQMEDALFADYEASFSNQKLLKQIFAKKPELKSAFAPFMGVPQPNKSPAAASPKPSGQVAPSGSEGPATLTNKTTTADVSEHERPATRQERKRQMLEQLRRYKSA